MLACVRYFVNADGIWDRAACEHFSSTKTKGVLRSLGKYSRVVLKVEREPPAPPVPDIMFWDPAWLRERARSINRKREALKKKVRSVIIKLLCARYRVHVTTSVRLFVIFYFRMGATMPKVLCTIN